MEAAAWPAAGKDALIEAALSASGDLSASESLHLSKAYGLIQALVDQNRRLKGG